MSGVFTTSWTRYFRAKCAYAHFNSRLNRFYQSAHKYQAASVNNQCIDFARYPNYRASHFIRDPRDLVVSGFFHHKKGTEWWTRTPNPTDADWQVVNGKVPRAVSDKGDCSFWDYLQTCSLEDGLLAEIEFREPHFKAMAEWDYKNPACLEMRYEDILGHEEEAFAALCDHYGFNGRRKTLAIRYARENTAGSESNKNRDHVRNPITGQWQAAFTPNVKQLFKEKYGDLVIQLGYEADADW
jgi:hypothetical protein